TGSGSHGCDRGSGSQASGSVLTVGLPASGESAVGGSTDAGAVPGVAPGVIPGVVTGDSGTVPAPPPTPPPPAPAPPTAGATPGAGASQTLRPCSMSAP